MYFCKYISSVVSWFKRMLDKVSKTRCNMIKVLMFDIEGRNKKEINTITVMVAEYIQSMWICRRDNVDPLDMINVIKNKMKATRCMLIRAYDVSKTFTDEYVNLNFM